MKKFRKLTAMVTALCLAGCMMASMSVFADAENEEAGGTTTTSTSISITNENTDGIYTAYQIFQGTLANDELTITNWGSGVNGTDLLAALKEATFGESASKPFASCTNAAEVADVVSTFKDNSDEAYIFASLAAAYTSTGTEVSNTATNVEEGYYIIKGGSGDTITKYILKVVGSVNIELKIGAPKAIKKVKENTKDIDGDEDQGFTIDATYNDVADWNIGDTVPFQLYGSMPENIDDYKAYRYIFHDTINATCFDLTNTEPSTVTVTIDGAPVEPDEVRIDKDKGKIDILFYDIKSKADVTSESIVKVEYSAVLSTSANIGLPGQENEVYLEYSNNPNWNGNGNDKPNKGNETPDKPGPDTPEDEDTTNHTEEDKVIVFTYEIDVTKIDGITQKELAGAKFELSDADGNVIYVNAAGKVCKSTDEGATKTLVSDANGKFIVSGLDDGTYFLEETKAPEDSNGKEYNLLKEHIEVIINASTENNQAWGFTPSDALTDLAVTYDGDDATINDYKGIGSFNVENKKGIELPSTGGIGTTLFYMVGGVLVVGAGVTLIAKKRVKNEQ